MEITIGKLTILNHPLFSQEEKYACFLKLKVA